MFRLISDTVAELQGHSDLTRRIRRQIEAGDREAAEVFSTGTLSAALTGKGLDARGEEVMEYVRRVLEVDGNADRLAWLRVH